MLARGPVDLVFVEAAVNDHNYDALNFPLPVILESGLKPAKHTITIRTTDKQSSRQALHVIHVLLN